MATTGEGLPDPLAAASAADFVECLNRLRDWCGQPSFRRLRRLAGVTRSPGGAEVAALPESTVSTVLLGKRLPRLPRMSFVDAYVAACLRACGWPPARIDGELARWRRAWRELTGPDAADPAGARPADDPESPGTTVADDDGAGVPQELPPEIATFTGRERAIEALDRLLDGDGRAPIAITAIDGIAGVGKTALAVHWARRVADRFPGGQLYVDLGGHGTDRPMEPADALGRLLRSLGLPPEHVPNGEEERLARYRSLLAGRRVLLVLDDARTAEQVRPLLPPHSGCRALVTSRKRLAGLAALDDAQLLSIGTLATDEAVRLLTRILGANRVENEPDAAAELARLCGHLPLALRIAAAHLASREQTIAGMVAHLTRGDRLSALRIPDDPRAAVRGAFDQSYRALDERTRRLFRRLGLLTGPDFSLHCAAHLVEEAIDDVHGLLEQLVAVHMVKRGGDGRYSLHSLMRDYAAERAGVEDHEGERLAAVERACVWYVNTALAASRTLNPSSLPNFEAIFGPVPPVSASYPRLDVSTQREALAWCEAERANLAAAVRQAADLGLHQISCQLSVALWWFFFAGKHWADWITTHRTALGSARALGSHHMRAWILNRLGHAYAMTQVYPAAVDCCRLSSSIFADIAGPAGGIGRAANEYVLADVYRQMGKFDVAVDRLERFRAIIGELDTEGCSFRWLEASSAHLSGTVHQDVGDPVTAIGYLREALAMMRRIGHAHGEARAHSSLGECEEELGAFQQAVGHYRRALAIYRRLGNRWGEAETLGSLASALHRVDQVDAARDHAHQAAQIRARLGVDSPWT